MELTTLGVNVRRARTPDVPSIQRLIDPLVQQRVLLGKDLVVLYEAVQEFSVAEVVETGEIVGCGALHVMWGDLAEARTLAVAPNWGHRGVGGELLEGLVVAARELGVSRVFCLTFEVEFFRGHGFETLIDPGIDGEAYLQLLRSHDEGVAEFLELARVKPNTLGNTRMIRHL